MREATNLSWTGTPFGAARRPFSERTSLLAAFCVLGDGGGSPAAAGAVYLRLPRDGCLLVTDSTLRLGFHAVAVEDPAERRAVVTTVDGLLVQARRQAAILAGHCFAEQLASLTAAAGALPIRGITAVAAAWRDRKTERGLAHLHDTAHGLTATALADRCAYYRLHGLPADPGPATSQAPPGRVGSRAGADLLRRVVVQALASGLIAGREAGHYRWDEVHLDAVIEAAAWDQTGAVPAGRDGESPVAEGAR